MIRWAYIIVECKSDDARLLCHYGRAGWELVSVTADGPDHSRFYLKRPIDDTEQRQE